MSHSEAILDRILRLTDRVIENRDCITSLKLEVKDLKTEMTEVRRELRGRSEHSMTSIATTFLKEVMPPKYWAFMIFLLLASILGITSPKDILAQFIEPPEHKGQP